MSPHKTTNGDKHRPDLASAVSDAHAKYRAKNPISAKAHSEARAYLPGGNTRTVLHASPFPLAIASGSGNKLTSVDGHVYTDFLGEFSAGVFGHSHPQIADAVIAALKNGWNYGGENMYEKELAKKVTERFAAGGLELVRFTNSGTEANTTLIGASLIFTGRKKILVFTNGYHGSTVMFPMELCRWMHSAAPGSKCPLNSMNLPHDFVIAPWNDRAKTKAVIDSLPANSLAAVLIEPVQGASGCRPALPSFLQYLRTTATALGALLIIDEVMASRLSPSGTMASLGIKADLMSLGKWIGGGMTFGAFGGRRDVMEMFDPARGTKGLVHPGTYNNNVFSMSAGIVGLDVFSPLAVQKLNALGDRLKTGITSALFEYGIYSPEQAEWLADPIEVDSLEGETRLYAGSENDLLPLPKVFISGRGSMLNLRFTGDDGPQWHNLYYHYMLDNGVYIASRGYTPLNLMLTEENIDMFVATVKRFLQGHSMELAKTPT